LSFSKRTSWQRQSNKPTILREHLIAQGRSIADLTISNPTDCGFDYSGILPPLANTNVLTYNPDPHGLLQARQAVVRYYQEKNIQLDPKNIFLTANSSEAYSHIFKLLCDVGNAVLVPRPSYPLFDYLAQLSDVRLVDYDLCYDGEWHIDLVSLKNSIRDEHGGIKAIVLVNPHNPTGMFLKKDEYASIIEIANSFKLALIVDEVFIDYPFTDDAKRLYSTAGEKNVLTFTLNGISKACGLPQMKLGWIVVGGQPDNVCETIARLEIICDTYLSVSTPIQVSLAGLFDAGIIIRRQIRDRVLANYMFLKNIIGLNNPCSLLHIEGGWSAVLRIPHIKSDEQWSLELLENKSIYVHPGYFFDFDNKGYLVLSLLVKESAFQNTIGDLIEYIKKF